MADMEVYLDNSATTQARSEVVEIVRKTMVEDYGNPSSMHRKGMEGEMYIRRAAQQIAATLKVEPKEIYFTSGGTESDNWALIGCALANQRKGKHLIISSIEHPAVGEAAKYLKEEGFEITYLPVDKKGVVSLASLQGAVRPDTILVSLMMVNNEIGAVEPVEEVGKWLKKERPDICFHVDAVQGYGKFRIYPGKWGIDMLAVSGHKIHGPKGVGFLYVQKEVKLLPLIRGGGQQNNMRSGTDNVPGIAGLGLAAEMICRGMEERVKMIRGLKRELYEGLSSLDGVIFHGPELEEGAPHILHASFLGVRSEVLLHALEDRGIYVSAGSACATHKKQKSLTLEVLGVPDEEKESALRFSLSEYNQPEEIAYTVQVIGELLPMLRRYRRS